MASISPQAKSTLGNFATRLGLDWFSSQLIWLQAFSSYQITSSFFRQVSGLHRAYLKELADVPQVLSDLGQEYMDTDCVGSDSELDDLLTTDAGS